MRTGGGGAGGLARLAEPENAEVPVWFSVKVMLVGVAASLRWVSPMLPSKYRLMDVDTVGVARKDEVSTLARSNE